MHRVSLTIVPLLALGLTATPARSADPGEHPVAGKLSIWGGHKHRIVLRASWVGATGTLTNPTAVTSTLRITGAPGEGDSGLIELGATHWKPLGHAKGFRYADRQGSAGGIRAIVLRATHRGGTLRIAGGGPHWRYAMDKRQTALTVSLAIGTARWCAAFDGALVRGTTDVVRAQSKTAPQSCPCDGTVRSTWEAVQTAVFARYGCTQDACHGSAVSGGLDLRPDVAYRNLVDAPATEVYPGAPKRVEPGDKSRSLLWLKLAKATIGTGFENVPGAGMPNGRAALTPEELQGVELWIHNGAPQTGVVAGTSGLLDTCLPPPDPIKIRPAPPPAAGEGIQLHAPPWQIAPRNAAGQNGEAEVCYATYYDDDAQIPDSAKTPCPDYWGGPTKSCFYFNRSELTQDPNSHHSIIHYYKGAYDISDPAAHFGPFSCLGGTNAGQSCDPKGPATQCPGGGCAGQVTHAVACLGYGPPDYGFSGTGSGTDNAPAIGGSQQPHLDSSYPAQVFGMLPTKGVIVWNSHAFNVTDQPTTNEQYFNLYFAPPTDRQYWIQGIFDTKDIFVQDVPPFERIEYCSTHTVPQGAQLFELSSHTHKRGVLFRIWGPGITPCQPGPTCQAEAGPPIVATTQYNDPIVYRYATPLALDGADPVSRTFKYCSIYDNGATDPSTVKRRSTSPPAIFGGKCSLATVACLNGPRAGQLCNGNDAACDSRPGGGDGVCDACPLTGGVTTEDEMFILLGSFYCPEGTSCYIPPP